MRSCFVIQPFDGGAFDKRYDDVFVPAIGKAGLTPCRVDRVRGVEVLIEEVEKQIRASDAVLADVTKDNPNVWYELGYASVAGKPTVLVCSREREKFPFDIQHRKIITYTTDSPRDFSKLTTDIADQLASLLEKYKQVDVAAAMSPMKSVQGLSPHEIAALVAISESCVVETDTITAHVVTNAMERAGFTRIAATIAYRQLKEKQFIAIEAETDYNGNSYTNLKATAGGFRWLCQNHHLFNLTKNNTKSKFEPETDESEEGDIPF